MGLDIIQYHFSCSMLHTLRQKALDFEGIDCNIMDFYFRKDITTKYRQFICFSDADGIYVTKDHPDYDRLKSEAMDKYGEYYWLYFGDLDKLREEVQELNDYMLANTVVGVKQAWVDYYMDVMVHSDKELKYR